MHSHVYTSIRLRAHESEAEEPHLRGEYYYYYYYY